MITAEQAYLQYHDKVRGYVRSKVQNAHDAEELVSAVFLKVVKQIHRFDPSRASLSTWIYTITRNTVTDHFRTHRTTVMLEDYMMGTTEPPELSNDTLNDLADALLTLKEKERDLIVLHYYKGYTLKAIAEMMGMSYINAKVIHKKALDSLRNHYADEMP